MKLIFGILFMAVALVSNAQQANPIAMTNPNGFAIDTITNATPEGPYVKVLGAQRTHVTINFQVTKISGTVAGTMALQGSNNPTYDATTFATIKNFGIDSLVTATNATNTYNFADVIGGFSYYRILWTGSGTMSASYKAYAYKSQ